MLGSVPNPLKNGKEAEYGISEYKQLQAAKNGGKLHTEYKELTEKKDKLYQEYGKLKKKVKQYDTIKQNVDSILRQAKQPERGKEAER